jgi:transposase-like protein
MTCPFCHRELTRNEIEMWDSFPCAHCHKLLRVRRNYPVRIFRITLITVVLFYFLTKVSAFLGRYLRISLFISAATIGIIDEYVMRLLPAKIEPAAQGGFTAS